MLFQLMNVSRDIFFVVFIYFFIIFNTLCSEIEHFENVMAIEK
jgi:hypothetical protein